MPVNQILMRLTLNTRAYMGSYDPKMCKTCQKQGLRLIRRARTLYSDCEEHFGLRVRKLLSTGVTIIHRGDKLPRGLFASRSQRR